ncbi:RNA recognition domain-containing protein [Colletotrichum scovillei]|uniref:Multiple RNA-binding domain-containing protein 1 n=1 Tax=Colletotrichum scovillei TaxID=1209932 RepID=A0A9P7QWR3_9PEZI|nr:RNA recognition domain-containing protein [Colletotrichum scovillei]KAF4783810.1 RNA recognition domain-containing protein [Colletotrichum scovillei]KAG7044597.1 RNA recognition domain-containing protein [Colletotrichum scovillei]KAG7049308.1 RNA recognition domain-containing protein [Colletotrichum scovillei]KAG7064049.1 RNA recognition domain-containing protein [Colletotrichum scovillei]
MAATAADATPLETSRIFVRGLPPKITDADFRQHFSAGGREVTDVKIIPQRRIGYVGFKTPEVAAKAVKYFNRSYIRMSRINVELARPIADLAPAKAKGTSGQMSVATPSASVAPPPASDEKDAKKKRKREDLDESDPKLREFLQVMGTGQSSANEMSDVMASAAVKEQKKLLQDDESDDEYEAIPSRPEKRQMREAPQGDGRTEPLPEKDEAMPDADPVSEPTEVMPQDETTSAPTNAAATDDDWLRSRTNRLLDLVEDGEVPRPPVQQDSGETVGSAPVEQQKQLAAEKPKAETDGGAVVQDAPVSQEVEEDATLATIKRNSRLFVRNLPFSAKDEDLRAHFEQFGELQEVHLPVTAGGASKGFAMVQFTSAESAVAAFQSTDGQTFQGRLLHVLPAEGKRDAGLDEFAISKLPLKKQNLIRKKADAASSTFNWNSLYMSQDAVNASVASRLGVSKSELLDPTSADAGVKQAIAETSIIQETKSYFVSNGVDLDALKSQKRGDTTILVKNFPFGTTMEELRTMFEEHGTVLRVLMPPSGTIAIVEFAQPTHAKAAFAKLAYRRIKDTVLFLEKGPKNLFKNDASVNMTQGKEDRPTGVQKLSVTELLGRDDQGEASVETTSLFVRNLNFSTTTDKLAETFKPLDGFASARVKTKMDPKKPGQVLSMGFGFVVFKTKEQAQAALKSMDGFVLEGHTLAVKASHKGQDAAEERRREDKARKAAGQRTKVVIKNLPFEATKKDIRTLFSTYGQLRAVRLPKKFGNSTRGFAFAEFVTPREAENALNALRDTHLLGRKLVLDYAEAEAVDAEEEIAKMQRKIGGQVNKVALSQLMGQNRKRVTIGDDNADEMDM